MRKPTGHIPRTAPATRQLSEAARERRDKVTFGQLLDEVRGVAHADATTQGMYQRQIERPIRPALGEYEVGYPEQYPEPLDRLYGGLSRCRRLRGGRH